MHRVLPIQHGISPKLLSQPDGQRINLVAAIQVFPQRHESVQRGERAEPGMERRVADAVVCNLAVSRGQGRGEQRSSRCPEIETTNDEHHTHTQTPGSSRRWAPPSRARPRPCRRRPPRRPAARIAAAAWTTGGRTHPDAPTRSWPRWSECAREATEGGALFRLSRSFPPLSSTFYLNICALDVHLKMQSSHPGARQGLSLNPAPLARTLKFVFHSTTSIISG